jgi:hypothetical protein
MWYSPQQRFQFALEDEMLKEVELGQEAIDYIKDSLSQGRTLSRYLCNLPLEQGVVTTWLPPASNSLFLTDFRMGGVITGEIRHEADAKLGEFVSKYLSRSSTRYAIFEHALARAGDPFLLSVATRFFVYGDEVYFFLTSEDSETINIMDAVKNAKTYLLTGVLAEVTTLPELRDHQQVTEEILRTIVDKTGYLIVGAYDEEGELIWKRP